MEQKESSPQPIYASKSDIETSNPSPPLARLALRVGVTGHRPNKLQSADEQQLRSQVQIALSFLKETTIELHKTVSEYYFADTPVLRVISPLAEGSDRIVAEEGLALGFELQCPLPFHREEYQIDFKSADSRARFQELLRNATAVLELDGSRSTPEFPERENESYEAVGRNVLNQSDVLIAIWDGESGKKGGTGQIVAEAERLGIPIIWIESNKPHDLNVRLESLKTKTPWKGSSHLVSERIGKLLVPPAQPKPRGPHMKPKLDLRESYFEEAQRKYTLGFVWKLLRDLIADFKLKMPTIRVKPFEESAANEWSHSQETSPCLPLEVLERNDAGLRNHYAWADRLADYYADAYRSAFAFNYLMAGFAVLFAFLSYAAHSRTFEDFGAIVNKAGAIASAFEVLIILGILLFTLFGIRKRWHERWIDYRLLAEQLRQQRFLMVLGRVLPSAPGVPVYVSDDDPGNSWIQWHCRAIVRAAGLINARFDDTYLVAASSFVNAEGVDKQVTYHKLNAERLERADKFLHTAGNTLFGLAAVTCTLHLLNYVMQLFDRHMFAHEGKVALFLTLITVVGPAFGAALTAIRFQGEFERVIKRSRAMEGQLRKISEELVEFGRPDAKRCSGALGEIATRGAQLMISEVLDWRTVFLERPLGLPA